MSEIRPDLNVTLANVAKTFDQKARLYRQKAAEAQAVIDGFQGELYAPAQRPIIAGALQSAANWEARAAEARAGYFLTRDEDLSDNEYLSEFGDVMTQAQQQGRAVYNSTIQAQQVQQMGADAPAV